MSCTISAWGTGGEDEALRIQLKRPKYNVNDAYALRSQVSGLFRQKYGHWPEVVAHSSEGEDDPDLDGGVEAGAEGAVAPVEGPTRG